MNTKNIFYLFLYIFIIASCQTSNENKFDSNNFLFNIVKKTKKNMVIRSTYTILDSSKKSFRIRIYNKKINADKYILDIDVYLSKWKTPKNDLWHITDINYKETVFDSGDVKLDVYLNQDATYLSSTGKHSVFSTQFNLKNQQNYAIRLAFFIYLTNKNDCTFDLFLSSPEPYKILSEDIKKMFNNNFYDIEILSDDLSIVYFPSR